MRITSAGRVGIGTITPTATLQISGSLIVSTTGQDTTPTLYAVTAGRLGIGTNAPSGTLDVELVVSTTNTNIAYFSSRGLSSSIAIRIKRKAPDVLEMYDTQDVQRILTTSYQGVGFGTGSIKTNVYDAAFGYLDGHFMVDGVTAYPMIGETTSGGANLMYIYHTSTTAVSDDFNIATVKISTATSRPTLTLNGQHLFFRTGVDGNNYPVNPIAMTISASGNVGIGTINPAISLTVIGEVQVSSSGAACSSAATGAIRYVSGTGLQTCNSAAWSTVGSGVSTLAAHAIGTKSLNYIGMIAPVVKAMQELKAANDNLRHELEELRVEVRELKSGVGYRRSGTR